MYGFNFSSKIVINGFDGTIPLNTYIAVPRPETWLADADWTDGVLSIESVLRFLDLSPLLLSTDDELWESYEKKNPIFVI
jgi:hypothetical protein